MDQSPDTRTGGSRLSLRLRLTLWMLAITLVLQLTLALVVLMYQRVSMGEYFSERARARAETISLAVRRASFQVTDQDLRRFAAESLRFTTAEQFVVALYHTDGSVLASSTPTPPPAEEVGLDRATLDGVPLVVRQFVSGVHESDAGHPDSRLTLMRLTATDGEEFVLLLATTDSHYEELTNLTRNVLTISVLIGALAAGIAGWMIAGLATAPLHEMRRLAGALSPEVIEQKVEVKPSSADTKDFEKDLNEVRSKLLQALHAQDRFITTVSHELKTPIAVLLTEAQTLRLSDISKEGQKFVQSVTEEMRRLGRMVESFLTLTKLGGGQGLVRTTPCPVNDFVMDAVQGCGKLARQYKVSLAPVLADCDPPLLVSGDAELLRVMVDNLISNAVRFSPESQRIIVRVSSEGSQAVVIVKDFGPGVPEELMDKLFDRFVQAPSEATRGRGHGLGLTIAQSIAELHGGGITVKNAAEGGCEFTIRLPLARDSACDGATASEPPSQKPALER